MSHAQRLRQRIEDEIVSGDLALGARLDENQLAARFGVSRTPIREALLQLAVTGLVQTKPRRGAIVSAPEPHLLLAMFETMAEIEAACGRLAARRLVADDAAALRAALEGCRAALATEDTESYYAENYVFHTVVYRASRNAFLAEQALSLHRRLAPYRRLQLRVRQRLPQSLAEHAAIVAAILSGDENGAAEALRSHVIVQGDRFTDLVAGLRAPSAA
ncbi:GntR family transcriptional regulator [Methylobacterium sp. P5_C11]